MIIGVVFIKFFGWGYIQNDNIIGFKCFLCFIKVFFDEFDEVFVVFVDCNNVQKYECKQLIMDVKFQYINVRFVVFYFVYNDVENI